MHYGSTHHDSARTHRRIGERQARLHPRTYSYPASHAGSLHRVAEHDGLRVLCQPRAGH